MSAPDPDTTGDSSDPIRLQLYVAGATPRTESALENLRRITEHDLQARCDVEVIDVVAHPERAEEERILATPTLVKTAPEPRRRITGDLSDLEEVLRVMGMTRPGRPRPPTREGP